MDIDLWGLDLSYLSFKKIFISSVLHNPSVITGIRKLFRVRYDIYDATGQGRPGTGTSTLEFPVDTQIPLSQIFLIPTDQQV